MRNPTNQKVTLKNLTSSTKFFYLGDKIRGVNLAAGQTKTVSINNDSLAWIQQHVQDGLLQLVGGSPLSMSLGSFDTPVFGEIIVTGNTSNGEYVNVVTPLTELRFVFAASAAGLTSAQRWVAAAGTAAASAAALRTAINAESVALGVVADAPVVVGSAYHVLVRSTVPGVYAATSFALTGVSGALSRNAFTNACYGRNAQCYLNTHTINETDETNEYVALPTGMTDVKDIVVTFRTAAGVFVPFDGSFKQGGGSLYLFPGTDTTFVEGAILTVMATSGASQKHNGSSG